MWKNLIQIVYKKIDEIKKYKNNPRNNESAIEKVANSIKEFGFKVPIIVDKYNTIIAGHTRYDACIRLGIKEIPCVVADDLKEEDVNAFRLADNKVSEYSEWDYIKLKEELESINIDDFNFEINNELDIKDDDFIKDTEITKEKKIKKYICPHCGEEFV